MPNKNQSIHGFVFDPFCDWDAAVWSVQHLNSAACVVLEAPELASRIATAVPDCKVILRKVIEPNIHMRDAEGYWIVRPDVVADYLTAWGGYDNRFWYMVGNEPSEQRENVAPYAVEIMAAFHRRGFKAAVGQWAAGQPWERELDSLAPIFENAAKYNALVTTHEYGGYPVYDPRFTGDAQMVGRCKTILDRFPNFDPARLVLSEVGCDDVSWAIPGSNSWLKLGLTPEQYAMSLNDAAERVWKPARIGGTCIFIVARQGQWVDRGFTVAPEYAPNFVNILSQCPPYDGRITDAVVVPPPPKTTWYAFFPKAETTYVNIRRDPDTSHEPIGALEYGTPVYLGARADAWQQIVRISDKLAGWVYTPLVEFLTVPPAPRVTEPEDPVVDLTPVLNAINALAARVSALEAAHAEVPPTPEPGNDLWEFTGVNTLAAPSGPAQASPAAMLLCDFGMLFWIGALDAIYVVYFDSPTPRWERFEDTWTEGVDPERVELPEYRGPQGYWQQPSRGFGKIWRDNPQVRLRLGFARFEWGDAYNCRYQFGTDGTLCITGPREQSFELYGARDGWKIVVASAG